MAAARPVHCVCTCPHARAFGSVCSARWLPAAAEQAAQSAFESPRSESMLLQHLLRDGHAALRCVRLHGRHTRCALRTAKVRVMVGARSAAAAQSHGMHCAVCAWHDAGGSRAHGTCALAIRQSAHPLLRHGRGHWARTACPLPMHCAAQCARTMSRALCHMGVCHRAAGAAGKVSGNTDDLGLSLAGAGRASMRAGRGSTWPVVAVSPCAVAYGCSRAPHAAVLAGHTVCYPPCTWAPR